MQTVSVEGQARTAVGKKAAKQTRREGRIPAVLYGDTDPVHFTVTEKDVKNLVYTPDFKTATLTVEGKTYTAILKEVQFHPVSDEIVHIDFLELVEGRTIKVEVPIRFQGNSPGVRAGGKLQQAVRRVKIKTTPDKLIDSVTLDISGLALGHSIRIRDIEPTEGIEIVNSPGIPVATVEIPRALRSATAAAERAAE